MYVCTFTISVYGTSGNELPPPADHSYHRSVLSGDESEAIFRKRMQEEGMAIRALLKEQFDAKPRAYSRADTCDWSITPVGAVTDLVKEIYEGWRAP